MAPTPAAHPSPPGRATLAGRLRPLDLDPPAPPPGRRPGRAGAPAVTGPLAQRRQRRRRRITPNANTATTTMISTHNHVDMAASLVGAGAVQADPTAAHPSKQLPASRRSRGGHDRHHRAGSPAGSWSTGLGPSTPSPGSGNSAASTPPRRSWDHLAVAAQSVRPPWAGHAGPQPRGGPPAGRGRSLAHGCRPSRPRTGVCGDRPCALPDPRVLDAGTAFSAQGTSQHRHAPARRADRPMTAFGRTGSNQVT
jgi:hypothetical protein